MSMADQRGTPLLEMRDMQKAFGGIRAVDHVSIDLYPGEVVGILGHNGAGKSVLMKMLSGAYPRDGGQIFVNGKEVQINNPRDARKYNIETIYQTLALADNLDAASNLFLGRELTTPMGFVDDPRMESETRKIMARLNPNFRRYNAPVSALSGGQRQSVAIARAVYFNAKILIMDEPTAALGVEETRMVAELIEELKRQGIGILLIDHDIHQVKELCDRASVMKNGRLVGTVKVDEVSEDDILGMIILGKNPGASTSRSVTTEPIMISAGPFGFAAATLAPISRSVPVTTFWVVRVPLSTSAIGISGETP
jgi:D-xylose transport system ATP-binding protein